MSGFGFQLNSLCHIKHSENIITVEMRLAQRTIWRKVAKMNSGHPFANEAEPTANSDTRARQHAYVNTVWRECDVLALCHVTLI